MITPVFSVNAYLTGTVTTVFNLQDVESVLWIRIPEHLTHLEIYEVVDAFGKSMVWQRCGHESWFKIPKDELNLSTGTHQYQAKLVDPISDWTTHIYFSYVIQNDNPSKPYYYMGNEREEE